MGAGRRRGNFHIEEFEKLLTRRTKLVAITQMSNALGTVTPIKEIVQIAHARGIPVLVDGSQGAVHMPVDVQDLGCDFFVFTGHKVYGPSGIGVLYGKNESSSHAPLQGRRRDDRRGLARRSSPTTIRRTGSRPARRRSSRRSGLARRSTTWSRSAGSASPRTSTISRPMRMSGCARSTRCASSATRRARARSISFELQGIHAHDVSMVIDRQGVAVRAGTHCAQPLLKRFGVTSTCRASFGMYNTRAEVDALAEALKRRESSSHE